MVMSSASSSALIKHSLLVSLLLVASTNAIPSGGGAPNVFAHMGARVNPNSNSNPAEPADEGPNRVSLGIKNLMATCQDGVFFGQSVYRPLQIDCPAEGESQLIELKFDTPDPNHGLSWSVAASYGSNKDQTKGIDIHILSKDANKFTAQGKVSHDTWKCSSAIYANNDNKICKTTSVVGVAEGNAAVAVTGSIVLTNTGGCTGTVYLEAALDDSDPTGNHHMHTCSQGMEIVATDSDKVQEVITGPPNDEAPPHGPVVMFNLSYAFPLGTVRAPTPEEVQGVLCRTEPYLTDLLRNHTKNPAVDMYARLLRYDYVEPDDDRDFAVDIFVVVNVTDMDTGEPIEATAVVNHMELNLSQSLTMSRKLPETPLTMMSSSTLGDGS